ncbi:MAG: hypothetical protein HYY22_00445 [Thaumarchaeota archaeon]|nr:hypothetical protein [Nitrososphaerota archaeon]
MSKNKIFTFIILLALLLPAAHSFGPPAEVFSKNRILVDTYHSGSIAGEGWPHMGDGWYYTTTEYLRDLGFTVISTDKPLMNYDLEYFSLIIEGSPDIDFSQEELNLISSYVSSGGSLLMTADTELFHNRTQVNDLASLFGVEFGGNFHSDKAWIVNEDTPIGSQILQGILEPPRENNGWFVYIDGVPITYPDSATVLIKFDGIDHINDTRYSDIAALIALEFGKGKILAGSHNGVMQPWFPTDADNQNPLFLNAISWLTNNPVSDTVIQKPSPTTPFEGVLVDAIIDLKDQIRDLEESVRNIEGPNEDLLKELNTSITGLQDEVDELKESTLDTVKDDGNSLKNLENSVNELKTTIKDDEDSIKHLENLVNELKTTNLVFSATTIISIMAVIVLLVIIRLNKS